MSDKQKQRIANDPVRAIKYGSQLSGFSDDFNKFWLDRVYLNWLLSLTIAKNDRPNRQHEIILSNQE